MLLIFRDRLFVGILVVAGIAALAEGATLILKWPAPPVKVCASVELGQLLERAAKTEEDLRAARAKLRIAPEDAEVKKVLRLEAESAAALAAVNDYKRQARQHPPEGGCR